MLIDTHCHIHDANYPLEASGVLERAALNDVGTMICVGTSVDESIRAVEFAKGYNNIFSSVGTHPHYADSLYDSLNNDINWQDPSIVAVGEIGLDYFYNHTMKNAQISALEWQIDLALRRNLPIIFHVREAFDDFWPVFDNFHGIRGVIHCFTDNPANARASLERNLMIGVGGFCTFVKDEKQKQMFVDLSLNNILLETDAPYLTPVPFRGKVNEPAFVMDIAKYLATIKNISVEEIGDLTTTNAKKLFKLEK